MKSQWQQQQDQQQAYMWQQKQKKKRLQQAQNVQSGGVNLQDIDGSVDVGGDIVGRDKINQKTYHIDGVTEEKNGCLVSIERVFMFIFGFALSSFVFGMFGVIIGGALGGEGGKIVGVMVALPLALIAAVVMAGNVSRRRW